MGLEPTTIPPVSLKEDALPLSYCSGHLSWWILRDSNSDPLSGTGPLTQRGFQLRQGPMLAVFAARHLYALKSEHSICSFPTVTAREVQMAFGERTLSLVELKGIEPKLGDQSKLPLQPHG